MICGLPIKVMPSSFVLEIPKINRLCCEEVHHPSIKLALSSRSSKNALKPLRKPRALSPSTSTTFLNDKLATLPSVLQQTRELLTKRVYSRYQLVSNVGFHHGTRGPASLVANSCVYGEEVCCTPRRS